jgi:hypothetical protein
VSIRIMSLVWTTALPDSEKLVLLALADCANDDGVCWPSMRALVAKCSKTDRTIQAAIKSLAAAGHLTRDERPGKGVLYTIHPTPEVASPPKSLPPEDIAPPKPATPTPEAASDKPSRTTIPLKASPSSGARERAKPVGEYHRLPEGWAPTRPLPASTQAKVDQWPPGKIDDELAGLHRWAANADNAKGKGRKLDWGAAWVNWLEKADSDWKPRNGQRSHYDRPAGAIESRRRARRDDVLDLGGGLGTG